MVWRVSGTTDGPLGVALVARKLAYNIKGLGASKVTAVMPTNDTFRFSSTKSYQLFHEGLDSLRSYEKGASSTELIEAEKHFRACVDAYPSDLLLASISQL